MTDIHIYFKNATSLSLTVESSCVNSLLQHWEEYLKNPDENECLLHIWGDDFNDHLLASEILRVRSSK